MRGLNLATMLARLSFIAAVSISTQVRLITQCGLSVSRTILRGPLIAGNNDALDNFNALQLADLGGVLQRSENHSSELRRLAEFVEVALLSVAVSPVLHRLRERKDDGDGKLALTVAVHTYVLNERAVLID